MPDKIGTVLVNFLLVHDECRAAPVDFSQSHVNFKITLVNERAYYPKPFRPGEMRKCLRRSRSPERTAFPFVLLFFDYGAMPVKIGTVPINLSRSHVNFKIALVNEKPYYPKLHNHFPIQKFFVPAF